MSIRSQAEEQKRREREKERKEMLGKFLREMCKLLKVWIRIDARVMCGLTVLYLFGAFCMDWDFFYETEIKATNIFGVLFVGAILSVIGCWGCAIFFYRKEYKRDKKK